MNLCRCLIKISGGETSGIGGAGEQSYPSTLQASSLAIIPYVIDASFPFFSPTPPTSFAFFFNPPYQFFRSPLIKREWYLDDLRETRPRGHGNKIQK